MNNNTYKNVVKLIRRYRGLSRNCLAVLVETFPKIDPNTLYSIVAIEYQKRMKSNHVKTQEMCNKYWDAYTHSMRNSDPYGIILRLAEQYDVCPCLVAKLILQKFFENEKLAASLVANDDDVDAADAADDVIINNTINVNAYLRDTTLIRDKHLAYEVFLCTLYDNLYSPSSDTMKHSLGQQYEIKLHNEIVALGLTFRDEDSLRRYGYDKTPDIKLEVPVAVDGFVISWIESKALFGDEYVHEDYTKNQYLSYWNRFGPGLVIYWFGYLDRLNNDDDKRFIIRDHLPRNIVQINTNLL